VGQLRRMLFFSHVIVWSIWHERNKRIFEGMEWPLQCFEDNSIKLSIFGIIETFVVPFLIF